MEMEDVQHDELLQMDSGQMRDVAVFVNSHPRSMPAPSSTPIVLQVSLSRDEDEEEDEGYISVHQQNQILVVAHEKFCR